VRVMDKAYEDARREIAEFKKVNFRSFDLIIILIFRRERNNTKNILSDFRKKNSIMQRFWKIKIGQNFEK